MEFGSSAFNLFFNFLWLSLVIYLIRALLPYAFVLRLLMLATGMLLTCYVAPRILLFYLSFWSIAWLFQQTMFWTRTRANAPLKTTLTTFCFALTLAPMVLWKLYPELFEKSISDVFSRLLWRLFPAIGPVDALVDFIAPIGLSFTTFRALDLLIKVRIGALEPLRLDKWFYCAFFPTVLATGPILEWEEIKCEGSLPRFVKPSDIAIGIARIALGLIKLNGLAFFLSGSALIFASFESAPSYRIVSGLFWFAWFFYFNFSGYSDLAIGAARLHGFRLKENFNNPFFQRSPQRFWANWHMSLIRFAQRNVFIPLGGFRASGQYRAIFATMMFIALWHAPTLPFVVFGIYHGAGLMMERAIQNRLRGKRSSRKRPSFAYGLLQTFATFVYVTASFPLLVLDSHQILPFYKAMLGLG